MRFEAIALRPSPGDAAGILDDEGFETDLAFADDEDEARVSGLDAGDDDEGPLESFDDELVPLPEHAPQGGDELFGPEEPEDEGPLFDDLDELAAHADDSEGPLLEDEGDLGLTDHDEPAAAHLEGEDEGVPADDASFDLVDLPPLAVDEDGALFDDDPLDDLELEPEPGVAPSPPRPSPAGVQDRSPPT